MGRKMFRGLEMDIVGVHHRVICLEIRLIGKPFPVSGLMA